MKKLTPDLNKFFYSHINTMSIDLNDYSNGNVPFIPPFLPKHDLIQMVDLAINMFNKDKVIVDLKPPCIIVGDIHGHILDLYNILKENGLPPEMTYVFLGDIIDRGKFSLECITFIYLLKVFYPENIFLLRGNHEFLLKQIDTTSKHNTGNTLYSECESIYNSSSVYYLFVNSFSYLPIAARIGEKIFCVHGGLNKKSLDLRDLEKVRRPLSEFDEDTEGYFWSDPREDQKILFTKSIRGTGFWFNEEAFNEFMRINKLSLMVRGHQFTEGPKFNFNKRMVTIFSASSYNSTKDNRSMIMFVNNDLKCATREMGPFAEPERPKLGSPIVKRISSFLDMSQTRSLSNRKKRRVVGSTSCPSLSALTSTANMCTSNGNLPRFLTSSLAYN